MTQPLALLLYEDLMPGSQLVNRLQDLHYRVQPLADATQMAESARSTRPMLILADLASTRADVCAAIAQLRKDPVTTHVPVIAFTDEGAEQLQAAGRQAGATLVVTDSAVLNHLPQLLEQALHLE